MAEVQMPDYKSNSHKQQEKDARIQEKEEFEVKSVVQGRAEKKKKTLGRRFVETFLNENVGDVKTYLVYDVIVPAIKENIADVINSAVGMLFFGEARRSRSRGSGSSGGTKVNYGSYFSSGSQRDTMPSYRRSGVPSKVDDITFDSRGDAEQVLDGMLEILDQFEQVTVSDYYDLCGVSSDFTDNKYGWTDLRDARVVRAGRDGFMISLPRERVLGR